MVLIVTAAVQTQTNRLPCEPPRFKPAFSGQESPRDAQKSFFDAIIASPFRAPELLVHTTVTLFSRKPSGGGPDFRSWDLSQGTAAVPDPKL